MKLFSVLLILITLTQGCRYLRPEQKILSEAADNNPAQTISSGNVTLNREVAGTLDDPNTLRRMIKGIMRQREINGVFKEGTSEIENTVFVLAGPNISIGRLAELALAINENGGRAYIPKNAVEVNSEPKDTSRPNPLSLFVHTGDISNEWMPNYSMYVEDADKYAHSPSFEIIDERMTVMIARILNNSIEISADGHYFINEKYDSVSETADVDDYPVKQRTFDISTLAIELPTIIKRNNKSKDSITIIASEKAPYVSLLKIFEVGNDMNAVFRVLIRRQDRSPKRRLAAGRVRPRPILLHSSRTYTTYCP